MRDTRLSVSRAARLLLAVTSAAAGTIAAAGSSAATPSAIGPTGPCGNSYSQRATAVGLPTLSDGSHTLSGAVDLRAFDGTASRVRLSTSAGGQGVTNARFGTAVAIQDVNHDGCEDLLIGAPGGIGSVHLVRGTPSGVSSAGSVTISAPDGRVGDNFGASIAVGHVKSDGTQDLWIGAPDATVGGKAHAGKVYHYLLAGTGVATYRGVAGYAASAVPGDSAVGDRFGSVLAVASGYDARTAAVLVGVPLREVAGRTNAGELVVLHQDVTGPIVGDARSQASTGVPGIPEAGDHFGAAVSVELLSGRIVAVGIPGEDVGPLRDAGTVQTFRLDLTSPGAVTIGVGPTYSGDSPSIPGAAETGDRFGTAVAVLSGSQGEDQYYAVAIGAPGESLGSVAGAGSVSVVVVSAVSPVPPATRVIYQGRGAEGTVEKDDNFGASVATVKGDEYNITDHPQDAFLIGVPGEDGRYHDSGLAQPSYSDTTSFGSVSGPVAGLRFGSVLATGGPGDQLVM